MNCQIQKQVISPPYKHSLRPLPNSIHSGQSRRMDSHPLFQQEQKEAIELDNSVLLSQRDACRGTTLVGDLQDSLRVRITST